MISTLVLLLKAALLLLFVYCFIAVVLVFSQKPTNMSGDSLDFSRMTDSDSAADAPLQKYTARDGANLQYRQYGTRTGPLIVLIHGSGAHSGLYEKLAKGISDIGTVIVPDLRGHGGQKPAGDVRYIGQLEDDLADLIEATRTSLSQRVYLVGHSSGGGLVIRFCGNEKYSKPHGVVLLAPYLGFNSPTVRADSGGWAQPLPRRIVGLTMLTALKLSFLNHLPVISFRLPDNGENLKMTGSYSFRMNTSFGPRYDFRSDMTNLPDFAILVGKNDEAFLANEFEPLLDSLNIKGNVELLDSLSHLDLIADELVH